MKEMEMKRMEVMREQSDRLLKDIAQELMSNADELEKAEKAGGAKNFLAEIVPILT